jgi:pimeloyl-ACP methyl ester carboxylesterase
MDAPSVGSWAPPETHYARSGSFSIAYQVLGDGPIDVVVVPSFVSNLELTWDWPPMAAFYRAFASFARVILFDKRGTGLSDRVRLMPTAATGASVTPFPHQSTTRCVLSKGDQWLT